MCLSLWQQPVMRDDPAFAGVNLGDKMFQGVYNDKQKHEPDFDKVLLRANEYGVERMIGEGNMPSVPFR
jgi:hypothetical protein